VSSDVVCMCLCHVQYLARLRMDLDIANKRLETVDEEKRKLMQERDEVGMTYCCLCILADRTAYAVRWAIVIIMSSVCLSVKKCIVVLEVVVGGLKVVPLCS